jgi:putative PIN family toxin of toxin-antitoxin system
MMSMPRAVLDTNVLVAGMRSRRGPAFRLLSLIGTGRFEIAISVALVFEYEEVLQRSTEMSEEAIGSLLAYLCRVARQQRIFYLWRPLLKDPEDDMILEVAVASRSQFLVTYNRRDFAGAERFGLSVIGPVEFLRLLGD